MKSYIDAFTYLKVDKTDGVYRSYVPSARMYRNYADYAYDIGLFAGKLSYEGLANKVFICGISFFENNILYY